MFDWIEFNAIGRNLDNAIKNYYRFSDSIESLIVPTSLPPYLKLNNKYGFSKDCENALNWINEQFYNSERLDIHEKFKKRLKQIENEVDLEFSHGDFHYNNVSSDLSIVDWDEWGYYPKGFDLAYLLSHFTFNSV